MYLKKIIAQGFKSFADNTVIDLDNNIAGIVGPNGSGKSNVVDAVRWVLGEQSVKSLRGDVSMTDVIFQGSKSRKPVSSASVTLIFDNSDHYINLAYDEISIRRRVFKDGTNEFFLNGEKCRLKDITDILMDSGIAKESFNIISQGKIEDILSSKPENRRVIFEEAAGVLKYKKRKIEALRKLEKTHDNMERINDIIKELEVQIEPLRDQKIKALEYLSLNDDLKELEIALIANDITNINYKYQEEKNRIEELNKEIIALGTSNSTNEAKTTSYKVKITNIENEIKETQDRLLELTSEVEKINSRKQIILEKKKLEVDDDKLHNNLISLNEEKLNLKNQINSNNNEIKVKDSKLKTVLDEIYDLEKEINNVKSDKDSKLSNLNRIVRDLSVLNGKINSLRDNIDNNSSLPFSVKSVLENPKLRGIHNCIGNLIEIDDKYSKAISIILGANASNVVVDNEVIAKEVIKYLKDNNLSRVTFFPLNIIKEKFIDNETLKILNNESGYINIASNLVKYDKTYSNIIKNQLGNVIVVDNIDNANIISKKINYRYRVVTIDGEVLHVGGAISGGVIKVRNIITDKYELEKNELLKNKLVSEQENIENLINEYDNNLSSIEDKLYIKNKEKIELQEFINTKEVSIKDIENKLIEIENSINSTNSKFNNTIDEEEQRVLNEYYEANKEKEEVATKLELLNNNKIKYTKELEDFEYEIKKDNSKYNSKTTELHELEISVNRADVKLDNLLNTLNETYSMTYENAVKLYKLDIDEKQARNTVNSLKRKIRDLGPVNTLAPEEYDKVSTRYEFLIHQQEDLAKAEATLLEIIDEMDSVMKEEFLKTFKVIQENFSTTFKELFKGGTAELSLTDSNNILETGIEINACPPGKTLKSINLLSGGEKTFTAISLLFAILKSRPVPFCILDEVEAALDEVNVDAFGKYLKGLKDMTQFIVITHKKKTMEYADILYGITMQESGVSKLVSVKLEEIK